MRASQAATQPHYTQAGPGTLSQQWLSADAGELAPEANWPVLYQHHESRLTYMRAWRYSWWWHWAELARLILPYRYKWVVTPNRANRGSPLNDAIINSTGTLAMRICAAGMLTGLMSPSRPWFRLAVGPEGYDPPGDAQQWLDEVGEVIYDILAGSNFYRVGAQMFQDLATFGTSPMIIYEDDEDIIRGYVPCAGEFLFALGGRLTVDTLYREFTYTIQQIVDWFGIDHCPAEVREAWRQGGASIEREMVVAHAIEPNFALSDRSSGGRKVTLVSGRWPFRETYWLRNQQTPAPLSLRGFNEQSFMALRWSETSNDPYGRSPGMDALPDIAGLQHEEVRYAEFLDKGVRPPMVGPPELQNQPASIRPGDITFVAGSGAKFEPAYMVNPTFLAPMVQDIERKEKRIDRAFYVDTFLAISQMDGIQPREVLELTLRQGEKIQQLGPVIESAERGLSTAIRRVAAIADRRGMLRPMPRSLMQLLHQHNSGIRIEYVSLMKLAQQAAETGSMTAVARFAAQMTEGAQAAGLPAPLRVLDLDGMVRDFADAVGMRARRIKGVTAVAQEDRAKAQAAQAAAAAQAALPAVTAAKSLAETPVGGPQNSALDMLLGTQQRAA